MTLRDPRDKLVDLIQEIREEQTSDDMFGGAIGERRAKSHVYASRILAAAEQIDDVLERIGSADAADEVPLAVEPAANKLREAYELIRWLCDEPRSPYTRDGDLEDQQAYDQWEADAPSHHDATLAAARSVANSAAISPVAADAEVEGLEPFGCPLPGACSCPGGEAELARRLGEAQREIARLTAALDAAQQGGAKVDPKLRALSEQATPGEWYVTTEKTEGSYGGGPNPGEGFDSYAIRVRGGKSYDEDKIILDAINSTVGIVSEEFDGDGIHAWDDVARACLEYVAAAVNDLRARLAAEDTRAASDRDEGGK